MPTQHIGTLFGHRVATCCNMLGVVGSNLKMVKIEPTTPNMSQHIATWWPNARNMLRPTMLTLRHVVLARCDRLASPNRQVLHSSYDNCLICLRQFEVYTNTIISILDVGL